MARKKIGWAFLKRILHRLASYIGSQSNSKYLWKGHNIFAIDGSKINLPKELESIKYRKPNKASYYPQGMMSTLFHLKLKIPYNYCFSRNLSEHAQVPRHLRCVPSNSVVVYDRGYFSLGLLNYHQKINVYGVFRLRTKGVAVLSEISKFCKSQEKDQVVEIIRDNVKIRIRFVRYKVKGQIYYLATTLIDKEKYPISSLKNLYYSRWGIEEFFKFLKQNLNFETFHSNKSCGVRQEIGIAHLLLLLSRLMIISLPRKKRKKKKSNEASRTKYNQGVALRLIASNFHLLWTKLGFVQKDLTEKIVVSLQKQTYEQLSGRSFQRKSHKVINRWQRNIAHAWRKKKSLEAKGIEP